MIGLLLACSAPAERATTGKPCGGCHAAPVGSHASTPCVACHHGDSTATAAEAGHVGLEAEPGTLDTVDGTCGPCHPSEVARVRTVPMTTGRGIVGVDRYVFGEAASPVTERTLGDVLAAPHPSPAEDHLRRLCAGCHLGTRRANRDDAVTGGSGCAACHRGDGPHPTVDAKVSDDRCFGCHSRSARVSLTFAGLDPLGVRGEPDAHAAAGMACIDCHLGTELMGDGVSRAMQSEQVEVRCESCHEDGPAVGVRGTPLTNVHGDTLVGKLDGAEHGIRRVPPDHGGRQHVRLDCAACHAAVAPTCGSCHTTFDPRGSQWDFGAGGVAPGRWVEVGAAGGWAPPALGVSGDRIRPAIPGMVGEVAGRPVRAYATLDPHSTRRASRACADCHSTPGALGLGSGRLDLATLRFTPDADDGWTTLGATAAGLRSGVRSLDSDEQRRVLRVGVCLGCHRPAEITGWPDLGSRPERCRAGRGWWDAR